MATNLVSIIMQYLSPDMIARIAGALDLDRNKAQSAVGAAVPGLLAGFSHVAEQSDGAQRLAEAVRRESGSLGSLTTLLDGGSDPSLIERGSRQLASVLGNRDEKALAGAIGNYAGVSRGTSDSLLGMLAPVVMGMIAQQQGTNTLDARGIAGFFAGQKDSIKAALPSGFSGLLSGTGLLDPVSSAAGTAAEAGRQAARAATSAVYTAGSTARRTADAVGTAAKTTPVFSGWYLLIPLALLALALAYFARVPQTNLAPTASVVENMTVSGVDLRNLVTGSMSNLRATLVDIKDTASAQAALPRLQQIGTQIDQALDLKSQLTATQRATLAGVINPNMDAIGTLSKQVFAIPGVASIVKPAIDSLVAKLATLAS